ncbi:MAG TPA: pitrilysin family protein [Burkholderiales bacterium]
MSRQASASPQVHARLRRTLPSRHVRWGCLLLATLALSAEARVQIEHWVAQSGARVYFVESHALPIVDVAVEFSAGSAYDPRERAGLGKLTLTLLKGGSSRYSETEAGRRIADAGAQLRDNFDLDRAGFSLRTLSSEAERKVAFDTLADMLQSPRFPNEVFEREQARAIANAREAETQPDRVAERNLYALMYPAHGYGITATPATLAAITREDVQRHYRTRYGSARAAVTIVGDLRGDEARALAEELTSRLAQGEDLVLAPIAPSRSGETLRIAHPSTQSHVLLGVPALAYGDPDYFPLVVGNYVLGGGGFVSRLMSEVRSKRGYAYSVYSYFHPSERDGPFLAGLETRRDQAGEALARTREVIAEFVARGPTESELNAARKSLVGGFPLRIDTNRKLLEQLTLIGFYRLPLDWLDRYPARVQAVTLEQVRSAFSRRLDPAKLSIVIVGAPD